MLKRKKRDICFTLLLRLMLSSAIEYLGSTILKVNVTKAIS